MNLDRTVAVVLAGGLGSRIQALYANLPKPMIPVNGRPFLEWVLRYLRREGIRCVVVSCGYKADVIRRYFAASPVEGMAIQTWAEPEPRGTAGGFLEAMGQSEHEADSWLVLNGDSLVVAALGSLYRLLESPHVQGALVGVNVPDTSRYGRVVSDSTGRLLHFEEKQPGQGTINAGVYLFRSSVLDLFPKVRPLSFETQVFPSLLAAGADLRVCSISAPFLDIGTPDSVAQAEDFVRGHCLNLWECPWLS